MSFHLVCGFMVLLLVVFPCFCRDKTLSFKSDGTFKVFVLRGTYNAKGAAQIVQFTDTHFGESNEKDSETQNVKYYNFYYYYYHYFVEFILKVMRVVLEEESPDLVWISGDWVAGYTYGWEGYFSIPLLSHSKS